MRITRVPTTLPEGFTPGAKPFNPHFKRRIITIQGLADTYSVHRHTMRSRIRSYGGLDHRDIRSIIAFVRHLEHLTSHVTPLAGPKAK